MLLALPFVAAAPVAEPVAQAVAAAPTTFNLMSTANSCGGDYLFGTPPYTNYLQFEQSLAGDDKFSIDSTTGYLKNSLGQVANTVYGGGEVYFVTVTDNALVCTLDSWNVLQCQLRAGAPSAPTGYKPVIGQFQCNTASKHLNWNQNGLNIQAVNLTAITPAK